MLYHSLVGINRHLIIVITYQGEKDSFREYTLRERG